MRSIRLSLVIYFSLLLAATVGAVSWFYYQNVEQNVRANEQSTAKLIKKQADESILKFQTDLDERLLHRVQTLARFTQSERTRVEPLLSLGLLTTTVIPQGHLSSLIYAEDYTWKHLTWMQKRFQLPSMFVDNIYVKSSKELMDSSPEAKSKEEYFQVFLGDGTPGERSDSMGRTAFGLDEKLKKTGLYDHQFDELELRPGVKVRRVTFKANLLRRLGFRPPPSSDFYLQYAANTKPRDQKIEDIKAQSRADLDTLALESDQEISDMHTRLLWVSLAALAAIIGGSICLVHLGLKPLARLSEAVSKISERDIRLRFDDPRLPRELQPIVDRLQQTLELLKRAFGREKQAAADISHELRTPLAALLTTLDVGLRKERSPEEYRELLEECRGSGQQMTQLVERMLALARLDSGVDQIRPREVDVEGLADQCASLVRPLADARGVKLRVHHHGPAPLNTDPDKLREVLTNLLHNAIEYNKPEGSIDVDVERENGHLQLQVRDTGIGISPEARSQIFERFYRADPSRQSEGLHAGIGLAIVKGYVDLMGGAIEVDSTVGQGSTFRLRLPVRN